MIDNSDAMLVDKAILSIILPIVGLGFFDHFLELLEQELE